MINHEDHCRTVELIRELEADNAQLRAQLAQLTKALRAIRDLQVGNTEVSYNAIRNLARAALEVTP